jgi:Na+-transporting methylmalonyl-CoA/oxaloacetate decarboxylase gamma subunit
MSPVILQSFAIYALAIAISLSVALLIRGIVAALTVFHKPPARPNPATVGAAKPTPTARREDDIAAIAAAVHTVLGAHRIVHIETSPRGLVWTAEARVSHHISHNVPRRRRR